MEREAGVSEWAMGHIYGSAERPGLLGYLEGDRCELDESIGAVARALDAARAQGRVEGIEESVAVVRAVGGHYRDQIERGDLSAAWGTTCEALHDLALDVRALAQREEKP